jgi:hypothetical protein
MVATDNFSLAAKVAVITGAGKGPWQSTTHRKISVLIHYRPARSKRSV